MKRIAQDKLIIRDSLLLPFRGSVIWGIELDSLSIHADIVAEKFSADIAYAARPSTPSLVAIHLTNTVISKELLEFMVTTLCRVSHLRKIAFIGLSFFIRRKLQKELLQCGCSFIFYFTKDYEQAKEWIVP